MIATNLTLPSDAVTRTMAILATKGAGKTYGAGVIAEEMLALSAQVVVIDPIGKWYGLRLGKDGKTPSGYDIVVFGGQRGDLPLDAGAGRFMAKLIVERRISAVLDVSLMRKADRRRFAADFAEDLYELKKIDQEPLHLFLEEAQFFIPQLTRDKGEGMQRMVGAFEDIGMTGRNFGLGLTMISLRPAAVAKAVLNLSEALFVLRTLGKHERKALEDWIDETGMENGDQLLAEVQSLADGTAYVWSPGWLRVAVKIAIREKRTFDSSATPKAGQKTHSPSKLTPLDIDAIRQAMAEVVAKVEAEDPAKLKRKIAELERALSKVAQQKPQPAPAVPAAPAKTKRVEVPIVSEATLGRIEKVVEKLAGVSAAGDAARAKLTAAIGTLIDFGGAAKRLRDTPIVLSPAPQRQAIEAKRRFGQAAASDRAVELPKGERIVLTAIAQHTSGVARDQLTVLTGYKRATRDAYVQRLRERGHVEVNGGVITLTPTGFVVLGPGFTPLPTGDALREHWMAKLPVGERRILEVLVEDFPNAVERNSITERTGYKTSTRNAYLQRLGSRRLITLDGNTPKASNDLFG